MEDKDWDRLIATAPTVPFSGRLFRGVAQLSFDRGRQYLFTSGKRSRCSPAGVSCLYMAEDRATALAEYDKYYTDADDHQPCLLYSGILKAGALLDLSDPVTMTHFGLSEPDFHSAFRVGPGYSRMEALGKAVSRQKKICAMRFPSDAMNAKSATGFNLAIFKNALTAPDSLRILGPKGQVLEDWPE